MSNFEASKHLGYLIKEVQHMLRTSMDNALRDIELTTPQYSILSELDEFPGLSNADLARRSFVTPQTMNLIVRSLEEHGLIAKEPNETHGRKQDIRLTEQGQKLLKRAHQAVGGIETGLFGCLSTLESKQFESALNKIVSSKKAK
jgi:DNA-binding MarR family transcriptional regulator